MRRLLQGLGSGATSGCYHGGNFAKDQVPWWANSGHLVPQAPMERRFRVAGFLR